MTMLFMPLGDGIVLYILTKLLGHTPDHPHSAVFSRSTLAAHLERRRANVLFGVVDVDGTVVLVDVDVDAFLVDAFGNAFVDAFVGTFVDEFVDEFGDAFGEAFGDAFWT